MRETAIIRDISPNGIVSTEKGARTKQFGGHIAIGGSYEQEGEISRAQELDSYIELLRLGVLAQDQEEELGRLARKFYLPKSVEEERKIIEAGGITYGL